MREEFRSRGRSLVPGGVPASGEPPRRTRPTLALQEAKMATAFQVRGDVILDPSLSTADTVKANHSWRPEKVLDVRCTVAAAEPAACASSGFVMRARIWLAPLARRPVPSPRAPALVSRALRSVVVTVVDLALSGRKAALTRRATLPRLHAGAGCSVVFKLTGSSSACQAQRQTAAHSGGTETQE